MDEKRGKRRGGIPLRQGEGGKGREKVAGWHPPKTTNGDEPVNHQASGKKNCVIVTQ
jgi:hypothetical protein